VLLVGGATRMPAIRRFVRNMTGLEAAEFVVDPDLAVALGAAVQAGIYEGQARVRGSVGGVPAALG
jgi:molecular chaperone DnaK